MLLPFTMAGSLFGRLSLEEGDSTNSLEVLEMKLGVEGRRQKSLFDRFSRVRFSHCGPNWRKKMNCSPTTVTARVCVHVDKFMATIRSAFLQSRCSLVMKRVEAGLEAACDIQNT